IQVTAGFDAHVGILVQLSDCEIDGEPLGDRVQIQDEWTAQQDRAPAAVQADIPKADIGRVDRRTDLLAGLVVDVEAELLEPGSNRGIECALGLFGQIQGERGYFEQQRAYAHGPPDATEQLHDFAGRIEARADSLDRGEPRQGALNRRLHDVARLVGDHLHVDQRVHRHGGEFVRRAGADTRKHLARPSWRYSAPA